MRPTKLTALAALFVALTPLGARADTTITMQTTMPMMAAPTTMKVYVSGNKTRSDMGMMGMSVIVDKTAGKMIMLMGPTHQYTVSKLSPDMLKAMSGQSQSAAMPNMKVVATGKTSTVMGHKTREYIVTSTTPMGKVVQDMQVAPDIAPVDPSSPGMANFGAPGKIHGMPLLVKSTMSMSQGNTITTTLRVTNISKAPIPASTFAIPAGYKQSTGGPGMFGAGMPH